MYVLSREQDERIRKLLADGLSTRAVVRLTGHSKNTVIARLSNTIPMKPRGVKPGPRDCDHCGKSLVGKKEFDRRTRRTKHKFCDSKCFNDYMRLAHANDQCKRCGIRCKDTRRKRKIYWSHGCCDRCSRILYIYGWDFEAAALHEITQSLKQELRNVERQRKTG